MGPRTAVGTDVLAPTPLLLCGRGRGGASSQVDQPLATTTTMEMMTSPTIM